MVQSFLLTPDQIDQAKAALTSLMSSTLEDELKEALTQRGLIKMVEEANYLIQVAKRPPFESLVSPNSRWWINDIYDAFTGDASPLNPGRMCSHTILFEACLSCVVGPRPSEPFNRPSQQDVHSALGPIFASWDEGLAAVVGRYAPS